MHETPGQAFTGHFWKELLFQSDGPAARARPGKMSRPASRERKRPEDAPAELTSDRLRSRLAGPKLRPARSPEMDRPEGWRRRREHRPHRVASAAVRHCPA